MRIGILAQLTGTTIPIIRSYETAGLLDCGRRRAGFREFGPEALEQVKLILACRSLKWSLPEIRNLLQELKSPGNLKPVRPHLQDLFEQMRRLDLLGKKVEQGSLEPCSTPEEPSSRLKIGQLADLTGLTKGSLDSMIKNGLLSCVRRQSGYRDFYPLAVEHIDLIVALRSLGYTITQTKTALTGTLTPEWSENLGASIKQRRASLTALANILQVLADSEGT